MAQKRLHCRHPQRFALLFRALVLWALILPVKGYATIIVVIYTKGGIWIGADSYRSSAGEHVATVCKVHETKFGLIVKSGESQGLRESEELYSTDQEIESLLDRSSTLEEFQKQLRMQFKEDVQQELAVLVDDPSVTAANMSQRRMDMPIPKELIPQLTRTVLMFDLSDRRAQAKVLVVRPQSDRIEGLFPVGYKYWAPSVWGWHPVEDVSESMRPNPSKKSAVHQFTTLTLYDRSETWIQQHPRLALNEILNKAHTENSRIVGPPYTIVHIIFRKSGPPTLRWISRGVCPGWTQTIDPAHSLLDLRNNMRKTKSE